MLKYIRAEITFSEIPEEVTLCIWITGCPNYCIGCHSPELREDKGIPLSDKRLKKLIEDNKGITCVCILGGDSEPGWVLHIMRYIKQYFPNIKTAWYSGREGLSPEISLNIHNFDYIKLGPYIERFGPLTSKTTNQKLYEIVEVLEDGGKAYWYDLKDITYKFWKDDKKEN